MGTNWKSVLGVGNEFKPGAVQNIDLPAFDADDLFVLEGGQHSYYSFRCCPNDVGQVGPGEVEIWGGVGRGSVVK